ncbi:unnamed protein product, partial [Ascophyllum nodosum]
MQARNHYSNCCRGLPMECCTDRVCKIVVQVTAPSTRSQFRRPVSRCCDWYCTADVKSMLNTKAYDSVYLTLLSTVLARFGVPQITISVIRQFRDCMRACVRLDDRVSSRWFAVEQSLRQGCVLAPLLSSIFFAAVINNVASTRFKADTGIMDALIHLR